MSETEQCARLPSVTTCHIVASRASIEQKCSASERNGCIMANMVVAVRPTVVIAGTVNAVQPRTKRDTGEVYKTDVTILTPSGGQTVVEYWERQDEPSPVLPNPLDRLSIVAEISPPNGNYGASFGFVRIATENDVDLIVSALPALAGK